MRKIWYIAGFLVLALAAYLIFSSGSSYAQGTVPGPMHWHPKLSIYINGEQVRIPDNLGINRQPHLPVHTHEEGDGTIHFEFEQMSVPRNQLTVGYFMNQVWGKRFTSTCILEYCNEGGKKVRMLVNGKESTEFASYVMMEGDAVEIRYG